MNKTHIEHIVYALLIQAAIGALSGDWWVGAAAGAFFFLGREHAQAEARVGNWAKYPEFECFSGKYWDLDSILDWVCPLIAVVVAGLVMAEVIA